MEATHQFYSENFRLHIRGLFVVFESVLFVGFAWCSPVVDIRGGWAPTAPHSHVISLHKGLVKSVIPHASSPFDSVGQLWADGYYAPYKRGAVQPAVSELPPRKAKLGSAPPQTRSHTYTCTRRTGAIHSITDLIRSDLSLLRLTHATCFQIRKHKTLWLILWFE